MALTKGDLNQINKLLTAQSKKNSKQLTSHTTQINKLLSVQDGKISKQLAAQTVQICGKMDELEEKFEEKLTEFKSDFFTKIDPILKEVVTAREGKLLIENRLEALEEIHPQGKHAIAI